MAKYCNITVIDQALDYISTNADLELACSALPATYAEAVGTYFLADASMSSSDYAKTGTTSRTLTVKSRAGANIDNGGTATHIALVKIGSPGTLIYVTTCTSLALTQSQTVNFGTWDITIGAP